MRIITVIAELRGIKGSEGRSTTLVDAEENKKYPARQPSLSHHFSAVCLPRRKGQAIDVVFRLDEVALSGSSHQRSAFHVS